jgi:protein-tyrosine-phosphatase
MKLIECIDIGNYGRSPLAEIFASDYFRQRNLDTEWAVISSGVGVDEINSRSEVSLEGNIEIANRQRLLLELGLTDRIKVFPEQTVARPDVFAILCLDKRTYRKVLGIYRETWYCPTICVMSNFANGTNEVPNSFGKSFEDYKRSIEQVAFELPLVLRKIIGE